MDRVIENNFFNWFGHDGAFSSCLQAMIWKYDLGDVKGMCSNLSLEDVALCEQDALLKCDGLTVDFQSIYEEIQDNLNDCHTAQSKENYCHDLLRPFSKFAHSVLPVTNNFQAIGDRANEIEKGFSDILHDNIKKNSIEWYFRFFHICVEEYSIMLDWVLMKNGIDLMAIQDKFNIHIKNGRRATEFFKWGGNFEAVQYYLNSLPSKGILAIDTPALDFLFSTKENMRNRFIDFFKTNPKRLKLTATDVVQILFLILNGRDRFDALGKNELSAKYLWSDLRCVGIIGGTAVKDVQDRTLNNAANKAAYPKPEVKDAWDEFNA